MCFLLGLDFGSREIGIVCRNDETQACGKPELPLPGLASFTLHALGRTEPALLDLMPPSSHLPSPSLAQILLLAQLQCIKFTLGIKCCSVLEGWLSWLKQRHLRAVTQLCHPLHGFLQSLPPHYCKNGTMFPYSAEILWCVSQGLILEVLLKGRRPTRYFLHVCASLKTVGKDQNL